MTKIYTPALIIALAKDAYVRGWIEAFKDGCDDNPPDDETLESWAIDKWYESPAHEALKRALGIKVNDPG